MKESNILNIVLMSSRFQILIIISEILQIYRKNVRCDMFEQNRKTFQLRERVRYSDEATGWTIFGSNSDRVKVFSLFSKMTRLAVGFSQPPIQ